MSFRPGDWPVLCGLECRGERSERGGLGVVPHRRMTRVASRLARILVAAGVAIACLGVSVNLPLAQSEAAVGTKFGPYSVSDVLSPSSSNTIQTISNQTGRVYEMNSASGTTAVVFSGGKNVAVLNGTTKAGFTSGNTSAAAAKNYSALSVLNGGTLTLYLAQGTTNSFTSPYVFGSALAASIRNAGIYVEKDSTLIIEGPGSLNATGGDGGAGIGGGLTVRDASGGLQLGDSGTIVINDGVIKAKGGINAAGIGGGSAGTGKGTAGSSTGWATAFAQSGPITINGGTVTADATGCAAGIGTGYASSPWGSILITGGVVNATSTADSSTGAGPGIGASGTSGLGSTAAGAKSITISGGIVTATSKGKSGTTGAAGIGVSLASSTYGAIAITGGIVHATSSTSGFTGVGGNSASTLAVTITSGSVYTADTSSTSTPILINGSESNGPVYGSQAVYLTTVKVQNASKATVGGAEISVAVDQASPLADYSYNARTESSGTAYLWLPKGKFTLDVYDPQSGAEGEGTVSVTDKGGSATITAADVAPAWSFSETPAADGSTVVGPTGKIYGQASLGLDLSNLHAGDNVFRAVKWYRENPLGSAMTASSFATGYAAATAENRGVAGVGAALAPRGTSSADEQHYAMDLSLNGRYWVEIDYTTRSGVAAARVDSVEIGDVYTPVSVYVRDLDLGTGTTLRDYTLIDPGSVYGIPYLVGGSIPVNPKLGFDTVAYTRNPAADQWLMTVPGLPFAATSSAASGSTILLDTNTDQSLDAAQPSSAAAKYYTVAYVKDASSRYVVTKDADHSWVGAYEWLADAVAGCGSDDSYTITATQDDPDLTGSRRGQNHSSGLAGEGSVVIPANRFISLTSDGATAYTITQLAPARHLSVHGSLNLGRIVLDGGLAQGGIDVAGPAGAGTAITGPVPSLVLGEGAVIRNSLPPATAQGAGFSGQGGGVSVTSGSFTMNDGLITGNRAGKGYAGSGGGVYVRNASFSMYGGLIAGNAARDGDADGGPGSGGGVMIDTGGVFTLEGGRIQGNTASAGLVPAGALTTTIAGGGVYLDAGARMTQLGGEIRGNVANNGAAPDGTGATTGLGSPLAARGGGVFIQAGASVAMYGGTIVGNLVNPDTAGGDGGGVVSLGSFVFGGGLIHGNATSVSGAGDGGGIMVGAGGSLTLTGEADVSGNGAPRGNGGGISTVTSSYESPVPDVDQAYANLTIAATALVHDNWSQLTRVKPNNAAAFALRALNPFDGDLLDNDQISFNPDGYRLVYRANGGTDAQGGAVADVESVTGSEGDGTVSVATASAVGFVGPIAQRSFTTWTTAADGTGDSYLPGARLTLTGDLVVYAQWAPTPTTVTISLQVVGDFADRTKPFAFCVKLDGNLGGQTVAYSGGTLSGSAATAPEDGTLDVSPDGTVNFTLSDGQSITLLNIAHASSVTVSQEPNPYYDTFFTDSADPFTQVNSPTTGVRPVQAGQRFDFSNAWETVPMTDLGLEQTGTQVVVTVLVLVVAGTGLAGWIWLRRRRLVG